MNFRHLLAGLGALVLLAAGSGVQAQQSQGISQHVAVCDPLFPTNCAAPKGGGYPPLKVSTTDKGGTVTAGGTAQAAIALNASRKYWCVMNGPAETETMYVRVNGTASATTGTPLQPGQQACTPPGVIDTAAVSVLAATTGHRWYGFEDQ